MRSAVPVSPCRIVTASFCRHTSRFNRPSTENEFADAGSLRSPAFFCKALIARLYIDLGFGSDSVPHNARQHQPDNVCNRMPLCRCLYHGLGTNLFDAKARLSQRRFETEADMDVCAFPCS